MNGFQLAGRPIKVGLGTEKISGEEEKALNDDDSKLSLRNEAQEEESLDTELNGVAVSREVLMHKLSRADDLAKKKGLKSQKESTCVLLKNMFDPKEYENLIDIMLFSETNCNRETSANWIQDLEDDVRNECEEKYGHVLCAKLIPDQSGYIYVQFADSNAAMLALKSLNGRLFGGRKIETQVIEESMFNKIK